MFEKKIEKKQETNSSIYLFVTISLSLTALYYKVIELNYNKYKQEFSLPN